MKFKIVGKAVGKERPRFGNGKTYTPQRTKDFEKLIQLSYLKQTDRKLYTTPIKIEIWAYYEPPKSISKKKYNSLIGQPYTKTPDSDNIAKSILDALNKIAYEDDRQVTELVVHKLYYSESYTTVNIEEVNDAG